MPLVTAVMATAIATLAPAGASGSVQAACQLAPAVGARFSGAVLQVMDGRSLCVALGPAPSRWVRVVLADAPPWSDRSTLMSAVFARRVDCLVIAAAGGGVAARCAIEETPAERRLLSFEHTHAGLDCPPAD